MPPKKPNVYFILAKTHKLTIFLNAPHPTAVRDLKVQALSALTSFTDLENGEIQNISSVSDFELCSAKRDKRGVVVEYDVLDSKVNVRDKLNNWEIIFFRFRNKTGELQPVFIEEPPDDDEEVPEPSPADVKGKRKAPPS